MTAGCPAPGTHSGLNRHRRSGTRPCDECRVFAAAYQRQRRAGSAAAREQARRESRARSTALALLAKKHPGEFADLLSRVRERLP